MEFNFDKLFDKKSYLDKQININLNYRKNQIDLNNDNNEKSSKERDEKISKNIFRDKTNRNVMGSNKINKNTNFIRDNYFENELELNQLYEINLNYLKKNKKSINKKIKINIEEFYSNKINSLIKIGIYKNGILFYNSEGVFSLFITNDFHMILLNTDCKTVKDEIFINYSDQDFLIAETQKNKISGNFILYKNNKFFKSNNKDKKLSKYYLLDSKKNNCIRIKTKLKDRYQINDYKVIKYLNLDSIDDFDDILDYLIFRRVIFNNEIFSQNYNFFNYNDFKKKKFNINNLDYMEKLYKKNLENICIKKLSKRNYFIKNHFGIKFENDGSISIGVFFNQLLQLFSCQIDVIGNKYIGQFFNGKLNGFGIINYIYNNSKIIGFFKNHKLNDVLILEDKIKSKFYFLKTMENTDELTLIKEFNGFFNLKILFELIKEYLYKIYNLEILLFSNKSFVNDLIFNKFKDDNSEEKNDEIVKKVKERLKKEEYQINDDLNIIDIYEIFTRKFKREIINPDFKCVDNKKDDLVINSSKNIKENVKIKLKDNLNNLENEFSFN